MIWTTSQQDPSAPDAPARDSFAILREIVGAVPDPFVVVDAAGTVLCANPPALALASDSNLVGDHLSQHIRSPAVLEAVSQVLKSGKPVQVDFERRTGGGRRYEAHVAPLFAHVRNRPQASLPAVAILIRDLTARQQLERMRVDFVANASHELRTPLASLTGFIETLQGAARSDPAAQEKFLTRMHEQARRMHRLVDDLLSLSRIEMNAHLPPADEVDVSEVLRSAVELFGPAAREAGCQLRIDAAAGILVCADRDQLLQVFQNLIENALKYGEPARGIDIALRTANEPQPEAVIDVRDYGPGIDAEHLPRLTERFYRVDVQASRARGGTGLGLAIVRHILLRHRGRLAIESRPGEGSTFTVRLPLAVQAAKAAE